MDPTDANEKWAPPSSLPDFGSAPRVRFTPPPPAWEPSYAPLGMRAKALAVDLLLALVVVIPLSLLSDGFNYSNVLLRIRFSAPPILLAMVLWMAYMTLMEGKYGAPLGKRATGLSVVREGGVPIALGAALTGNTIRSVDGLPGVAPYLLGFIVANRS